MLGVVATRQKAPVYGRVQCFHPTIHHFGETGHSGYICGIETGKSMVLRGRITEREGQSIIYNPRYELLAAHTPAA